MPPEMSPEEEKEAAAVLQALDSAEFRNPEFSEWLRSNAFEIFETPGEWDSHGVWWHYKGNHGFVSVDHPPGRLIMNCLYTPFSDLSVRIGLLVEGKSASGKTFSDEDLERLKELRYQEVEGVVIYAIAEAALTSPDEIKLDMTLEQDLQMDRELELVEVVMKVENSYNLTINDEEVSRFRTPADIIAFVRKSLGM